MSIEYQLRATKKLFFKAQCLGDEAGRPLLRIAPRIGRWKTKLLYDGILRRHRFIDSVAPAAGGALADAHGKARMVIRLRLHGSTIGCAMTSSSGRKASSC
jgi:hypothetical protein